MAVIGPADDFKARGVIAISATGLAQSFGMTIADSVFFGVTTAAALRITGGSIDLADLRLAFPGF